MTKNRIVAIACLVTWSAARPSLGAVAAPAAAAPPVQAPARPSSEDMAPIAIPNSTTKQSDFVDRLGKACKALIAGKELIASKADTKLAAAFAANNLNGLAQACADVAAGSSLTADDVASLRQFWTNPALIEASIKRAISQTPVTPAGTFSAISSGSLESDIIQGLAQFIYDRGKQEAVLYLRERLVDKLCSDTNKLFFPRLCVALAKTDPSIPLGAMGTYLVAAARADLAQLPDRTLAYALYENRPKELTPAGEVLFGARLGLAYYQTVRTGRGPLDVARSMHGIEIPPTVVGSRTEVLKMTKVLSRLLDAVQAQGVWTQPVDIKTSDGRTLASDAALGAVFTFEKICQDEKDTTSACSQIANDKIAAMIPSVARYIADTAVLANRITAAKRAVTSPIGALTSGGFNVGGAGQASASTTDLTMRDYAVAVTQLLDQMLASGQPILTGLGINVSPAVAKTIDDLGAVFQVGEQVASGQSGSELVISVIGLFDKLNASALVASSPAAMKDIQQLLALIAQIADSKSADEVANALNAAAAPLSSYELKYQRHIVALGAMVGVSGGYERVRTDGLGWSGSSFIGAFAPVGVTASWPMSKSFHAGAMISVINLGTLVSARFSDDVKTTTTGTGMTKMTVETNSEVKLANIFAPGLFGTIGLGGSPFTLAIGGQVVPEGRQLTTVAPDGTTTTTTRPAVQIVGALSVDVPIFAF